MAKEVKPRNFVKKASDQINKPKVFRDRKKKAKLEGTEDWKNDIKPQHKPYHRDKDWLDDDDEV